MPVYFPQLTSICRTTTFHFAISKPPKLKLLCMRLHRYVSSSTSSNDNLLSLLRSMQKAKLRHIKQREAGSLAPLSLAWFSVVGVGRDSPASVILNTNHFRYLFNCGEGTQRLLQEHRLRLSRLEQVFITRLDWSTLGGLPGVTLTLQDVGVPKLVMHAPVGLQTFYPTLSSFLHVFDTEIAHEEDAHVFNDSLVSIRAVPIFPAKDGGVPAGSTTYKSVLAYIGRLAIRPGRLLITKCIDFGVPPGPLLGKLKNGETVTLRNGRVVTPEDVKEMDEPGSVFAVIDCPNETFIDNLITCQELHALNNPQRKEDGAKIVIHFTPLHIVRSERYAEWMRSFPPATYHWVLPDDGEYAEKHSFGDADMNSAWSRDVIPAHYNPYRMQAKLALIDDDTFPLLPRQRDPDGPKRYLQQFEALQQSLMQHTQLPTLRLMRPQQKFHLRASVTAERTGVVGFDCFDVTECLSIDNEAFRNEVFNQNVKFADVLQETQIALRLCDEKYAEKISDDGSGSPIKSSQQQQAAKFPLITFLGTGSSVPNKARNTSAILIDIDSDASILLDCSEGTYGQLYRHFGYDKIVDRLCRLKAVFVSHKHADHHLGLLELLLHRKRLRTSGKKPDLTPLLVIAPSNIFPALTQYNQNYEDIQHDYIFIANHVLLDNSIPMPDFLRQVSINFGTADGPRLKQWWKPPEIRFPLELPDAAAVEARIQRDVHLDAVQTCYVRHSVLQSFGVKLCHKDGWSLVYSGDTMPCDTLVQLARNCDVLIHEATMEDDLAAEAVKKMHSTTNDALQVAHAAQAKFLILTHFSQRYGKVPVFPQDSVFDLRKVAIAFDNMRIEPLNLAKNEKISLYPKVLQAMFLDECELIQDRNKRRQVARSIMSQDFQAVNGEGGGEGADEGEREEERPATSASNRSSKAVKIAKP